MKQQVHESLPIPDPNGNQFATLDVAMFFQRQLMELCREFGYTKKQYKKYLSWHQPQEFVEKISDPNRFFRVIHDEHGKIIAYMESRLTDAIAREHTIQWVFVADGYKKTGVAKELWASFFEYCAENQIRSVKSLVRYNNSISIAMHKKLGFQFVKENEDKDILYRLSLQI